MNASACQNCPIGFSQSDQGQASCITCSPGEFNDVAGTSTCKACLNFTYYGKKGRNASCIDCPTGWTSEVGSAKCQICGGGSFGGTFGGECQSCPLGYARHGTDLNASRCLQCNLGETTTINARRRVMQGGFPGATDCILCEIGTYGTENRVCLPCPPGNYSDSTKQTQCKSCVDGKVPNKPSAATDCQKPPWKIPSDCDITTQYLNDTGESRYFFWFIIS